MTLALPNKNRVFGLFTEPRLVILEILAILPAVPAISLSFIVCSQ